MQNDKLIEEPELLFSVNTLLAFLIAEKYYNSIHYAWFSPKFDLGNEQPLHLTLELYVIIFYVLLWQKINIVKN